MSLAHHNSSVLTTADILRFQVQEDLQQLTTGSEAPGVKIDPKEMIHDQAEMNRQLWLAQSVRSKANTLSLQFSLLNMLMPPEYKKPPGKCWVYGHHTVSLLI